MVSFSKMEILKTISDIVQELDFTQNTHEFMSGVWKDFCEEEYKSLNRLRSLTITSILLTTLQNFY